MNIIVKHFSELTKSELYQMLQLRSEVFVVEQNIAYQDMDDKDINAFQVLIFKNEILVATARILDKGVSYDEYSSIGRVCTKLTVRGEGIGKMLMETSIKHCQKHFSHSKIKISAQSYLLKFYTELGFRAIGDEYLEDGIPHTAMIWENKFNHMNA